MITNEKALQIAKDAFSTSTSYVDANYRQRWNDNLRMFNNKHPVGSKYYSDAYKYRSKGFRPKTRSVTRNAEAAAAAAFMSNRDAISVEPLSPKNKMQRASAELREYLLNYRLQHTIPWFMSVVGGMQDAQINGVVCSKQYWCIEHKEEEFESNNEFGQMEKKKEKLVITDEPKVDLYPIENIRIDPASNWIDPVNSSPYFIAMTPIFVGDVRAKIKKGEWQEVTDNELSAAKSKNADTTKQAREDDQEEAQAPRHAESINDFDIVWVHENFVRIDGEEMQYYTLGCEQMLSKKVSPLGDVYWHNVRPFVIGTCIVETHRIYPHSPIELGGELQREANEIRNSRMDNVRLAMNKRYIVKRGSQTDLKSLVRNVAASVTMATDVNDVRPMEFNDVTSSSFAEQDRINVDYDELLGSFSSGSIQSNRKLNETVGGMSMLKSSSNSLTQYLISVFSETWVEKVLIQLDKLEQNYESDEELIKTAVFELDLEKKYGITEIDDDFLSQRATVAVNVSNTNSDPIIKLDQFISAIKIYSDISANPPAGVDMNEVKKEVFSFLGYRDGRRFIQDDDVDPEIQKMQEVIKQLQAKVEGKELEALQKMETEKLKDEGATERNNQDNETKLIIEAGRHKSKEQDDKDDGEGDEMKGVFEILQDLALQIDQLKQDHEALASK